MSWLGGLMPSGRKPAPSGEPGHLALFEGLCALHELDQPSRELLEGAVVARQLAHPARVFLEPEWLEPSTITGLSQEQAASLARLRDWLFDRA